MKRRSIFFTASVILILNQNYFTQNTKNSGLTQIKDLIVYEIQVTNPTKVSLDSLKKNNLREYQYMPLNDYLREVENKYFNSYQTKVFIDEIKLSLKNKNVVFFDGDCGQIISIEKANSKVSLIDSIKLVNSYGEDSVDVNGDIMFKKITDEYYYLKNISKIRFFEEWKLNNQTSILEKNIIGYSIIGTKQMFGEEFEVDLFGIAKDKNSLNKIRQHRGISNYCE